MTVERLSLPGVLLFRPRTFRDDRGHFREVWRQDRYRAAGVERGFVQDNLSRSEGGVLRGLHFQNPRPQGKLVSVAAGEIYDVAVDIRAGSPTFGVWAGATLRAESGEQLYVPEGFAHGFVVLSTEAVVVYKCTDYFDSEGDQCIRWDDPEIGIEWPTEVPTLSAKDAAAPRLSELDPASLPQFSVCS